MSISSPQYSRLSKEWKRLIGQTGKVVFCTETSSIPNTRAVAMVQFESERKLIPVALGFSVSSGDSVVAVLRRRHPRTKDTSNDVIEYRVSVRPE